MDDGQARQIVERLTDVRLRIAAAANAARRDPEAIRLVAVSKFQPEAAIAAAVAAGQTDFGESRAKELTTKLAASIGVARWHFVGRLQRNKVRDVVGRVALIHSVDRPSLATAIAERAARDGRTQSVLIQVDLRGEHRKGGCAPTDLPALLAHAEELDGIAVAGLMTIPPIDDAPGAAFADLARLRDRFQPSHPTLVELSMGMSADLETAVAHGATIVRIGTAVFGARPQRP